MWYNRLSTGAGSADAVRAEKPGGRDELGSSGVLDEHPVGDCEQQKQGCGHIHFHLRRCGEHEAQGARRRCGAVHGDGWGHGAFLRRGEVRRTVDEQHAKVG
ncbi:hypothetical protein PVAP13_4NG102219 [Panicum virgatum]|uniref:Uncharacterized protein n=1 Tax=Panicum virgatum TaxID=38727 RepID=A0A8T0TA30_PANVG|nr:hypothetical protein PVAP13_4NG102219 [Panicum virgatum]